MTSYSECTFDKVQVVERSLKVLFNNGKTIKFEDCWLRDHCRCSTCYHADTNQRAIHILDIPDSKISSIRVSETELVIVWDDQHESSFNCNFLAQFEYSEWLEGRRFKPKLWAGAEVSSKVPRVTASDFLNSEDGAKRVFQSLLDYGFVFVVEVEPNLKSTEVVCQALGGVQQTLFGGMWQFTTNAVHADTAYTSLALAAHNDSTYFTEATGLQVLHCFDHTNGTGGETLLVDGFHGATRLKEEHPEDFDFLTKFNVEAEYVEPGHNHRYAAPVIKINSDSGDLEQIRYNVYDRTAMAFESGEICRSYYRSLRNLARYYQDSCNQWRFKLSPGMVLVMDNFRVLHGRTGFTGSRVMGGCYVARSDWLDRARVLGLIK